MWSTVGGAVIKSTAAGKSMERNQVTSHFLLNDEPLT